MQAFIEANWLSILSILIGVVVSYFFYRLQKKDSVSASVERKKHATNELLDVIESYIINKQRLSEHVIDNLIRASERNHSVSLLPACTPVSMLQDVALRLQRSRHLDIPQKTEYSETIEALIHQVRLPHENKITQAASSVTSMQLDELSAAVPPEQREAFKKKLATYLAAMESQKDKSSRKKDNAEYLAVSTALFGVAAAMATSLLGSKLFEHASTPVLALSEKLFPVLGAMLALVVAMQAAITVIRIKKRSNPTKASLESESNV